jgi:hypothetical protein
MIAYQNYAKEIMAKSNRLSELIKHSSSIGVYLEHLIGNFLKGFLGNRFSIKTGFIKNPITGITSKQIDLMIIDENMPSPYLFKDDDFVVALPDSIVCAIEIKQQFNKENFNDMVDKTNQFNKLCIFPFIAFFYENTTKKDQTVYNWYKNISLSDNTKIYPYEIFVLDSYIIKYMPEPYCQPSGSYLIKFQNRFQDDKPELIITHFILSIIKACELRIMKLDKNTVLNFFGPDFDCIFEVKHCCMRYGIGMERPIKVFDTILGDSHA